MPRSSYVAVAWGGSICQDCSPPRGIFWCDPAIGWREGHKSAGFGHDNRGCCICTMLCRICTVIRHTAAVCRIIGRFTPGKAMAAAGDSGLGWGEMSLADAKT